MIKKMYPKPQVGLRELCRWLRCILEGVRGRVVWICTLGVLRVSASLGFVWVSKMLIDNATDRSTPMRVIWLLSALLTACMLAEMFFSQANIYMRSLTAQRLTNSTRRRIYGHLLRSEHYADVRHSGDLINRITLDVTSVVDALVKIIPDILVMAVQLGAAFWLLCMMSPMLALCALLITPICILSSKAYIVKMRRINAEIRQGESRIQTNLQEGLQHRIVVQTLECAPEITSRFERLQQAVFGDVVWRSRVNMYSRTTVRIGFIAGYLIAFIWSVFGLHTGAITYGIMTAFLQLVGRIQNPISSLSNTIPGLVGTATAIDRLIEIYPLSAAASGEGKEAPGLTGYEKAGVRVSNVTFAYPGSQVNVFEGFSHDFAPASKTVIMGETGVGKSTLTKLILALLHPQQGTVEVYSDTGSEPVSSATRSLMTYVPQGNSLLHGTIRDNLLLGKADATEDQMRQALDIAVANFVFDLPEGLDTQCGELGSALSEGQCQRIAIARALLRDCPVLVLDEFNSSLDQDTAETLMQRLMAARPDATIIFISHRPDVAAYCDTVLRID